MRSPSQHSFARVPRASIPRSSFDRSFSHKTTFDAGYLIPLRVSEVLPGDTVNSRMTGFMRLLSSMDFPIIDNMRASVFSFFVPNRLLWDNWEKFCGAQTDPGDSIAYTIPVVSSNTTFDNTAVSTQTALYDYMGLPHVASLDMTEINSLPFRAYFKIFNDWFRDQNLQDSEPEDTSDGPDSATVSYHVVRRGKRHDYFTSCLPWPQKGDSVDLPLGTSAPVVTSATATVSGAQSALLFAETTAGGTPTGNEPLAVRGSDGMLFDDTDHVASLGSQTLYPSNLEADLSTATAATINQLRQAFQIQKLLERDARGGTRYTEIVRSHFGVISPDQRLQRPEYLGGGVIPLNTHAVTQTAPTTGSEHKGSLSGFATAAGDVSFTKSFTEHGYILTLICVDADLTYQQGLERKWTRSTRYDFFWPALALIGEQSVLQKEIFYTSGGAGNEDVFGYQERYGEYRYSPGRISGELRSDNALSLDVWHLAEDFPSAPSLDSTFIESSPPIDRVITITTQHHFIGDFLFQERWARPMPMFGVPGLIDHF